MCDLPALVVLVKASCGVRATRRNQRAIRARDQAHQEREITLYVWVSRPR